VRPWLKGALLLTVAFVLGVAAGAVGSAHWRAKWSDLGPGSRASRAMLRHLDRELGLAPAQREQLEAILRETGQEFGRLRDEVRPRLREIRLRSRARMREVLDPAQRERFDALAARWQERRSRHPDDVAGPPRGR
jgi:Spy/CpxP family protein refolding chaperone